MLHIMSCSSYTEVVHDFNDVLDSINDQGKYSETGFSRGFSLGRQTGFKEGFLMGRRNACKKLRNCYTKSSFLSSSFILNLYSSQSSSLFTCFSFFLTSYSLLSGSLAAEIGFYQGYTAAWLTMFEKKMKKENEEQDHEEVTNNMIRKIQALKSLNDMATSFFKEELTSSTNDTLTSHREFNETVKSFGPKLNMMRAKFRYIQSFLESCSPAATSPFLSRLKLFDGKS